MVQGGYQDIVAGTVGNLPHQGTNGADGERRKEQSKCLHRIGLYEHLMQNASGSGQYHSGCGIMERIIHPGIVL